MSTSTTIQFQNYPTPNRVPGFYLEIDATQANTATAVQRTLIIGQMLASGTALASVPHVSVGPSEAIQSYGAGSQLASMVAKYRNTDSTGEVWCLPLLDNGAAQHGSATATYAGTATAAGTATLYISGQIVQAGVNVGDTATVVAGNLQTALSKFPNLPVTGAAAAGVLTVTSKHEGQGAGEVILLPNFGGIGAGQSTPAGITVAIAQTPGQTDPDLTSALLNLGDKAFDLICLPYSTSTPISEVENLLNDTSGRWAWNNMIYGHAFSAVSDTFANAVALGGTLNNQHVSILPVNGQPEPAYLVAAALTAAAANSLRTSPALPLNTVPLDIIAPRTQDQFTFSQRETLLNTGLSTFRVSDSGAATIERIITTYQSNAEGAPDNSYLNVNVPFQLAYVSRAFNTAFSTQFARKIVVADGTRVAVGSNAVTPTTIRNAAIAVYTQLASEFIVQDIATFIQNVYCEYQGNGLVALYLPVNLSGQLEVIAARVQFIQS